MQTNKAAKIQNAGNVKKNFRIVAIPTLRIMRQISMFISLFERHFAI